MPRIPLYTQARYANYDGPQYPQLQPGQYPQFQAGQPQPGQEGLPQGGMDAQGRPHIPQSPTQDTSPYSPVEGPPQQPPYGGPTYPSPDGWGHTDPLGHPYSRSARYTEDPHGGEFGDGTSPTPQGEELDYDCHYGESGSGLEELYGILHHAMTLLAPHCQQNCQ